MTNSGTAAVMAAYDPALTLATPEHPVPRFTYPWSLTEAPAQSHDPLMLLIAEHELHTYARDLAEALTEYSRSPWSIAEGRADPHAVTPVGTARPPLNYFPFATPAFSGKGPVWWSHRGLYRHLTRRPEWSGDRATTLTLFIARSLFPAAVCAPYQHNLYSGSYNTLHDGPVVDVGQPCIGLADLDTNNVLARDDAAPWAKNIRTFLYHLDTPIETIATTLGDYRRDTWTS